MRALILAALLALPMASQADCQWTMQNDNLKYSRDKKWHLEQTALGTVALSAINDAADLGLSRSQVFWLGVLPGFVHELGTACDKNRQRSQRAFSHQDMVYNMIGAAIGVGLGEGVRVMLGKDSAAIEWSF